MAGHSANRLALGTVQLGLDYGITNLAGQTGKAEAGAILARAIAAGVGAIDTAPTYGDSESLIGEALNQDVTIDIVTKTPRFGSDVNAENVAQSFKRSLTRSLKRLRRPSVHALLFHDAADLLGPHGPALWQAAENARGAGLIARIGVSAYLDTPLLDRIMDAFPVDIVQIPYSALDQRAAASGLLDRLATAGVEVHARSLFLQGLLLLPAERLPPGFEPLAEAVGALHAAFRRHDLDPLAGLLAVGFADQRIARLVCGVTSLAELEAILLAARRAEEVGAIELPELPAIAPEFLNPARWPKGKAWAQRRKDEQWLS